MEKYLAIFYGGENPKLVPFEATLETLDAQKLYDDNTPGEEIDSILVLRSGLTWGGEEGRTILTDTPRNVATFYKGKHFSQRVESLDAAVETIKTWIDNLDDPDAIAQLLGQITGAVNVRVISRNSKDALIGYDMP